MLVSTVQQSESAVCIHVAPLFWFSFPFKSPQSIILPSLLKNRVSQPKRKVGYFAHSAFHSFIHALYEILLGLYPVPKWLVSALTVTLAWWPHLVIMSPSSFLCERMLNILNFQDCFGDQTRQRLKTEVLWKYEKIALCSGTLSREHNIYTIVNADFTAPLGSR